MSTPILEDPVRRDALLQRDGFSVDKVALLFQANDLQQLARELWDKLGHVEADYEQMLASYERRIHHFEIQTFRMIHEVEQSLGKALGYPELYPDASAVDDGTVCTGDHVPESLAAEAAACLVTQRNELHELRHSLALTQNNVELQQQRFEREWERAQGLQGALNLNCETAIKLGAMLETALQERDALQAELARYRTE